MSNLPATTSTAPLPSTSIEAAAEFARESYSSNTLRAYRAQFALWSAWAVARDQKPMPADPGVFAMWLAERANQGAARATIAGALAALCWAHELQGLPCDTRAPILKHTLRGINRSASTARVVKQAKPIKPGMLRVILTAARTRHEKRDAAVLAMLYSFGLRRSELVALDFQLRGDGLGILAIEGNIATVTLLRSKASQQDAESVAIERDTNPAAFAAIETWVALAKLEAGTPFIRGIDPAGTISVRRLHPNSVSIAVKAAVERHLIRDGTAPAKARQLADAYSGHSGRVGLVVASVEAGASDAAIMNVSRHRSPTMIARYGKQARAMMASPHKLKGVAV